MVLLPEQEKKFIERLDALEKEYYSLVETKRNSNDLCVRNNSQAIEYSYKILEMYNEIRNLKALLKSSVVGKDISDSKISVGSKFTATISSMGIAYTTTYTLVDTAAQIAGQNIVTTSSPMGQAVYGKGQYDLFSYSVYNVEFIGQINEVNTLEKSKTIVK